MSEVTELNDKAKLVGMNHVALEVGSIDEALHSMGATIATGVDELWSTLAAF